MIDIRNSYFFYEILRKACLFGLRTAPIRKALAIKPGEKILDAGCGYGLFAQYCKRADYTGIDTDVRRILQAKKRISESDFCRFLVSDVTQTPFRPKTFDKALGYGLLHHLPDDMAKLSVQELGRIVRGLIIFSEPVFARFHMISNLLCNLDSGHYVRDREGYIDICQSGLSIIKTQYFYSRNGLAKYLLIAAIPKESR